MSFCTVANSGTSKSVQQSVQFCAVSALTPTQPSRQRSTPGIGVRRFCGGGMPSFLGREGSTDGVYNIRGEPLPEPRNLFLRQAAAEPALHGVILRVVGEAPTQGWWGAELRPLAGGEPDAAGIVSFELVAIPPQTVQAVGPARTRTLSAAVFFPTLALEDLRGFRVAGGGAVQTLPLR